MRRRFDFCAISKMRKIKCYSYNSHLNVEFSACVKLIVSSIFLKLPKQNVADSGVFLRKMFNSKSDGLVYSIICLYALLTIFVDTISLNYSIALFIQIDSMYIRGCGGPEILCPKRKILPAISYYIKCLMEQHVNGSRLAF